MRQDRRTNGWVLIGSIVELILSLVLLLGGVALAVGGFMYESKLAKIDQLQYFINQRGIEKAQEFFFDGKLLKFEYLYLALGIIAGIIGLILLVYAIKSLVYVKKHKVVRRRVALVIFALLPLVIVGASVTYLVFEMDNLPTLIKYGLYGVIGGFGFVFLCKILGVMFGRSEQFMSNDNNKYAFNNSSIRNARADINNNRNPQNQPMIQRQIQVRANQNNVMQQNKSERPLPKPTSPVRPNTNEQGARPMPQGGRPNPNMQGQPRPNMQPNRPQGAMPPRNPNMVQGGVQRPAQAGNMPQGGRPLPRPNPQAVATRYCPKCGKMLAPGEKSCSLCGYKVQS